MAAKQNIIGLVLQGGGALGAYEVGALIRIYEHGLRPEIISGTSIGAINAAVLAAPKGDGPINTLKALWEHLQSDPPAFVPKRFHQMYSSFGHQNFYQLRPDFYNMEYWPSLYDIKPALRTIEKFIDFERLNSEQATTIAVTATNIETGEIETFSNKNTELTPNHLMASGALPPSFPPIEVDGSHYWDGGIYDNTPTDSLIDIINEHQIETMPIFILELFSHKGAVPKNIQDALDRMTELVYEDKFWKSFDGHDNANDFAHMLWQLDKEIPQDSKIRNNPFFQKIMHNRCINHIFTIKAEHVPLSGVSDFSSQTINERINKGYKAADNFFQYHYQQVEEVFNGKMNK